VIDWFTVTAQIINFLILVLLLKKFLYGPIIRAMDKREEIIAGRLNDAQQTRLEAQQEIETYRQKNEDLESQRAAMLTEAKAAAEQREKELIETARKEVEDIKARWRQAVAQEKEAFFGNLRSKIAEELSAVARRMFSDLADISMEEHLTEKFIQKINALDPTEQEKLRSALKDALAGVTVAASFEIPQQKREALRETVRRITGRDAQPEFVVSQDILCGIELRAQGYTLSWNVDEYMGSLEEAFGRELEG